jgi:catechol 2,3-dioxygenase-like lactoylglutathione lyase family enzyme
VSGNGLLAAYPQLFVADMAVACDFYVCRLGFSVEFLAGEPPFYGQVVRDGVRLNFRCVDVPVIDPARADIEELLAAYIPVADVDALFAEFQTAGATFRDFLQLRPWGRRDFVVRDPDGNLLCFADG